MRVEFTPTIRLDGSVSWTAFLMDGPDEYPLAIGQGRSLEAAQAQAEANYRGAEALDIVFSRN